MAEFGGGDEQAEEEVAKPVEATEAAAKPSAKHVLMQEEERTRGSAGWPVFKAFLKAGNGAVWLPVLIGALILNQAVTVLSAYTLVWWQRNEFNRSTGFYVRASEALGSN